VEIARLAERVDFSKMNHRRRVGTGEILGVQRPILVSSGVRVRPDRLARRGLEAAHLLERLAVRERGVEEIDEITGDDGAGESGSAIGRATPA